MAVYALVAMANCDSSQRREGEEREGGAPPLCPLGWAWAAGERKGIAG